MHARHIARMDPDVALQVLAPAQARMTRTAAGSRPGTGLAARLLDTGLAPTAFGAALRRVARPRGAIARRAARADGAALTLLPRTVSVLASLQPRAMLSRLVDLPVTARVARARGAEPADPAHRHHLGRGDRAAPSRPSPAARPSPSCRSARTCR